MTLTTMPPGIGEGEVEVSSATEEVGQVEPDAQDPRDRERQVADIVARLCTRHRVGEPAAVALRTVLADTPAPVAVRLLDAVDVDPDRGLQRLARRWQSPILATLADAFRESADGALDVQYLHAVAVATAVEHRAPGRLALKRLDPRHGLPWDEAEDQRLVAAYEQGATVEALCAQHERNANAIRARLVKHGLLEDDRPSRRGET